MPGTLIEEFAGQLAAPPALSDAARRSVLLHVFDSLGAWIAGSATDEGRGLRAFAPSLGNAAADRVALHCGTVRLSEIDDIHLASLVTPAAIAVPTALTLAAEAGADNERVLHAIAAGYQAAVRLGIALDGAAILYRGIWPTYITAPFAAAAVAVRLFDLDERRTANALALALSLSPPAVGQQTGAQTSRWLACGLAARSGVTAAIAARAGFIADRSLLDGHIFPSVYALTPDRAKLLAGGEATTEVSFKPWCAARQTMAATQALRELLADGVTAADITGIVAAVPEIQLKMVGHGVRAGDRISHLTSLPYVMALAALAPDQLFDIRHTPDVIAADVQALMAKTEVEADEGLSAQYPTVWGGRVTVRTRAGAKTKTISAVPGDPLLPLGQEQLTDKLRRVITTVISARLAAAVLAEKVRLLGGDVIGATTAALSAAELTL
jgi:2-methylcitrate dehydratase PrpD